MSAHYVIRSFMADDTWYWAASGQGDRRASMWGKDPMRIRVYDTPEQAQEVVKYHIQNPVAVGILKLTDAQWERIKEARSHDQERRRHGRFIMKEME